MLNDIYAASAARSVVRGVSRPRQRFPARSIARSAVAHATGAAWHDKTYAPKAAYVRHAAPRRVQRTRYAFTSAKRYATTYVVCHVAMLQLLRVARHYCVAARCFIIIYGEHKQKRRGAALPLAREPRSRD